MRVCVPEFGRNAGTEWFGKGGTISKNGEGVPAATVNPAESQLEFPHKAFILNFRSTDAQDAERATEACPPLAERLNVEFG